MLQTGLRKQLSELVLDDGCISDGHVARQGSPYASITVRGGVGKKLGRGLNIQCFRQNDLVPRPRGFQIGDDLGVVGEISDELSLDRQLHSVLDFWNGPNTP